MELNVDSEKRSAFPQHENLKRVGVTADQQDRKRQKLDQGPDDSLPEALEKNHWLTEEALDPINA